MRRKCILVLLSLIIFLGCSTFDENGILEKDADAVIAEKNIKQLSVELTEGTQAWDWIPIEAWRPRSKWEEFLPEKRGGGGR